MADNAENTAPTTQPIVMSRRLLCKHLQKINLHDGDVLAVKASSQTAKKEILEGIVKALERIGRKNIILVVVDDMRDLSVLDEKEMAKHGWFRVQTLQKLVHTGPEKERAKEAEDGEDGA